MNFIKKNINELRYADYNPRKKLTPEDKEYQKIKRSIEEFGYVDPIIINKDNTIIGGHQRVTVLKDLGYEEINVIQIDIDKTKEKALNIALNKITGSWDYAMLGDLLLDLDAENYDLEITGFDLDEIEDLMAPIGVDKYGEDFFLQDGDKEPIITMSITFSDDQARIINEAISKMKKTERYKNYEDEHNKNSNGNSLFLVVEEWLEQRK